MCAALVPKFKEPGAIGLFLKVCASLAAAFVGLYGIVYHPYAVIVTVVAGTLFWTEVAFNGTSFVSPLFYFFWDASGFFGKFWGKWLLATIILGGAGLGVLANGIWFHEWSSRLWFVAPFVLAGPFLISGVISVVCLAIAVALVMVDDTLKPVSDDA